MNTKNLAIISIILIVIGVVVFIFGNNDKTQTNSKEFPEHPHPDQVMVTDEPIGDISDTVINGELGEYEELTFTDNTLDTSDWATYRNEEFGFKVKYPGDWKMREYTSPEGEFAFYHSKSHGADNGIYIDIARNSEFTYNPDVYTKVTINNMYGYFASQGIPKTRFIETGIVLKNIDANKNTTYSMYFFVDPQNPGNFDYNDVFEQMLLSFELI